MKAVDGKKKVDEEKADNDAYAKKKNDAEAEAAADKKKVDEETA